MKPLLIAASICLTVLCTTGAILLAASVRENHRLAGSNESLREELQTLRKELEAACSQRRETSVRLAETEEKAEVLGGRVAELESAAAAPSEPAPRVVVPKPFQVKAWLGRDFLGWAWLVPGNVKRDADSGAIQYEPMLWLDEKLRNDFVVYQTNYVEVPVETSRTINNTYYPQPVYFLTSGQHRNHTPRSPGRTPNPPSTTPPPFNPGTGALPAERIGTPATRIATRPQVLGTPAGRIRTFPRADLITTPAR